MRFLTKLLLIWALQPASDVLAAPVEPLPFGVRINGIENRFPVFAVFARPEQTLTVELTNLGERQVEVHFDGVHLSRDGQRLRLRMPSSPGTHHLDLSDEHHNTMRLNLFVMWTSDSNRSGALNGYRIGSYPRQPLRGLEIYQPPSAFVEVTASNAHLHVSPNFTLGQFVCKQNQGFPKYLVLRPELLQKLETVLAALQTVNERVHGLTVMSGFRTPSYNRAIGNGQYSRHVWGGAADVFVDSDGDNVMDDLNGDGRLNRDDATWLAAFVDDLERMGKVGPHIGGIGIYGSTPTHGPFVHVDARGFRARW